LLSDSQPLAHSRMALRRTKLVIQSGW
jgi:hypothetical protein